MDMSLLRIVIAAETDIVLVRSRTRRLAELIGFDAQDQTRITTAVSEIARNTFTYAGGGRIDFYIEGRTSPQLLVARVVDSGPGIAALDSILAGRYQSSTGMGVGIIGARRLMDHFIVDSTPAGVDRRMLGPR